MAGAASSSWRCAVRRKQVTHIITYGRPGTPMPAWGVASGKGVLNEQGIGDLVNYVQSIDTTPRRPRRRRGRRSCARLRHAAPLVHEAARRPGGAGRGRKWVTDARAELAAAEAERTRRATADRPRHLRQARAAEAGDPRRSPRTGSRPTQSPPTGQLLFMTTAPAATRAAGRSSIPPTREANPPPGAQGGGAYGPNLTGGDVNGQFPPPDGGPSSSSWISVGRAGQRAVRHPRHLVGPHAPLRQRADQGADPGDHGLRAVLVMGRVSILAKEQIDKTLWYPTILGVLVVVAGSCCSAARSTCCSARTSAPGSGSSSRSPVSPASWWSSPSCGCTTESPLNTLKGRIPQWKSSAGRQQPRPVQDHRGQEDHTRQDKVDTTEASNVKAAVDAALVTKVRRPTIEATPNDNRFAKFASVTKYMILKTYEIGGSDPQFWKGEFTHTDAVRGRRVLRSAAVEQPFGLPPLPPECDNRRREVRLRDPRARPRLAAAPAVRCVLIVVDPLRPRPARPALAGEGRDEPRRRRGGPPRRRSRPGRLRRRRSDHAASDSVVSSRSRLGAWRRCRAGACPPGAQQLVDAGKEGDGSVASPSCSWS